MSSTPDKHVFSIQVDPYQRPRFKEKQGKQYVEYGLDNRYDRYLNDLKNGSPTHGAIVNRAAKMIAGAGVNLDARTTAEKEAVLRVSKIFGDELVYKSALDIKLYGNFFWAVIWNLDRSQVIKIEHVPMRMIRCGVCDSLGKISHYYVGNFKDDGKPEGNLEKVAAWNLDGKEHKQIIHQKLYDPETHYYGIPDYAQSIDYIEVEQKVGVFHNSNLDNGMFPGMMVNFMNGRPSSDEEVEDIERQLKRKFSGAQNAGGIVITFNDGQDQKPEIIPLESNSNHEMFQTITEQATQMILTAHGVTSPLLFGLPANNGFGSNADEMRNAFDLYFNAEIRPLQRKIEEAAEMVLAVEMAAPTIEIKTEAPAGFLTLSTQVAEWLVELGEDEDEEWELVGSHPVDYELDDDMNVELLAYERTELARTVRSAPGKESEQDTSLFKVRYKYTEAKSSTRPVTHKSREFCQRMMRANKIYRKEDIIRAGDQAVNPGWGLAGARTYSIWDFKGGGGCQHYWERVIYLKKGGKIGVNEARKMINKLPVAERAAAKWEQNDKSVATPPREMANGGFITKKW